MKLRTTLRLLLFAALWILSSKAFAVDSIVLYWNNAALEATRETHSGPPQAARTLAMIHTCMYNAWAAYDPVARSTVPDTDLRRPLSEASIQNKSKAISYAAHIAA